MATIATHGFKTSLAYAGALTGTDLNTPVYVAQVESIGDINLVCDDIEVTNQDSLVAYNSKALKEYIPGNIEGGEIAVACVHTEDDISTASGTDTMVDKLALAAAATYYWRIKLSDLSYWIFHGYIKAVSMSGMTTTDAIRFSLTIKIDGAYSNALPSFVSADA